MHMIAHNADAIELKGILFLTLIQRIQQHLPTFEPSEFEFAIVTAQSNVVAILREETTDFSHDPLFGSLAVRSP